MRLKTPIIIFLLTRLYSWATLALFAFLYVERPEGTPPSAVIKEALSAWDVGHYLLIIRQGYHPDIECAFFPLLPLLSGSLARLTGDPLLSGVLISNLACFTAVIIFYNLVHTSHGARTALIAVTCFLVAPTSVFYLTLYTEALFFLFTVTFFYLLQKKSWGSAACFAFLAAGTRNIGVFLLIPFLYESYISKITVQQLKRIPSFRHKLRAILSHTHWRTIVYSLLIVSGLGCYMVYLQYLYADPLMFLHAAAKGWPERSHMVFPFWDFLKHIKNFTVEFQLKVSTDRVNLSFLYFLVTILLLVYKWRKIPFSQTLYLLMVMLLISVQPRLTSASRYLSAIFPLWVLLGVFIEERKEWRLWFKTGLAALLIWQLYTNWRWVNNMWVG